MCNILLILTSMYPEQDPSQHPRLCIVFNNVSKNKYPETMVPEYCKVIDECDEEESKDGPDRTSETDVSPSKYIQDYKALLIDAIAKQYEKLEQQFIIDRIEKLFPEENFYFYQMRTDPEEMQLEWE